MKLLNAGDAINDLEEHMNDLYEVIESYETIIKNLKKVTGKPLSRQKLYDAGFTDEQIDKFIEILLEDD